MIMREKRKTKNYNLKICFFKKKLKTNTKDTKNSKHFNYFFKCFILTVLLLNVNGELIFR